MHHQEIFNRGRGSVLEFLVCWQIVYIHCVSVMNDQYSYSALKITIGQSSTPNPRPGIGMKSPSAYAAKTNSLILLAHNTMCAISIQSQWFWTSDTNTDGINFSRCTNGYLQKIKIYFIVHRIQRITIKELRWLQKQIVKIKTIQYRMSLEESCIFEHDSRSLTC